MPLTCVIRNITKSGEETVKLTAAGEMICGSLTRARPEVAVSQEPTLGGKEEERLEVEGDFFGRKLVG